MKSRKIFTEIISVLYISLMLYTALSKLKDYSLTREQMAMMPLLTSVAAMIAWLLPTIEIIIAVLIFLPGTRQIGLKIVTFLMVFFCIYIVYMMTYYKDLPCSCGGFLDELSWTGHLIFNGIFIILGFVAVLINRKVREARVSKGTLVSN